MIDISKEVEEFQKAFKEGGLLTRLFLVLGFFFSISSLTSLSSVIVDWKGFILEGINFYQHYFVETVVSVASPLGLSYSQAEIHTATISSITVAIGMRILAVGQLAAFRVINEKYKSDLKPNLNFYWAMAILYAVCIWVWYGVADPQIRPWVAACVTVFYPIFIVAPKYMLALFGSASLEKGRYSYFKSYYIYVISLVLIVCALAAINV
ncbi:hypothetical protein [Rheinheimera sp.]|uniref:hypothetical protein n=1 Tax=Rheinheimera sp. TaxID=1869214 RepID=UPI0037CB0694